MLLPYGAIDFEAIYDLADGQAVVGLIAAGQEHVVDTKIMKKDAHPFLKRFFPWNNGMPQ